ncbi:MAG TPA: UDP-glucose--hexose-1-phosphate uridylyltransferase [Candidatus Limnocylindrales bacterium]|nr:UDP-glucose--hexose-1-phosphate uridylyltransferase [Candidatus Limnocylindrales bacterium]
MTARLPGQPRARSAGPEQGTLRIDDWPGLAERPHRRYNALLDEWVLVSGERTRRPWHGRHESIPPEQRPAFDPGCYLCPGNTRANGETNPDYASTWVFTNDYAALLPESPDERVEAGLLRAEDESGTCRVVCFSRRHDLTLARMEPDDVRRVVDVWADQTAELGERYRWVQVFENRGDTMGASIPHPHGQVWAGDALPNIAAREDAAQLTHLRRHGGRLLLDYAEQESGGRRVVAEDDDWLAVVPFWAQWPYETLLIARRPVERLPDLRGPQRDSLAAILIRLLRAYDGLFRLSFPYSMGWHQAPCGGGLDAVGHWQLHAHFLPPLLGATVRKFMVGYELLAEPQRDLAAEDAADRLRAALEEASAD